MRSNPLHAGNGAGAAGLALAASPARQQPLAQGGSSAAAWQPRGSTPLRSPVLMSSPQRQPLQHLQLPPPLPGAAELPPPAMVSNPLFSRSPGRVAFAPRGASSGAGAPARMAPSMEDPWA